jgi:hypothetical protein
LPVASTSTWFGEKPEVHHCCLVAQMFDYTFRLKRKRNWITKPMKTLGVCFYWKVL